VDRPLCPSSQAASLAVAASCCWDISNADKPAEKRCQQVLRFLTRAFLRSQAMYDRHAHTIGAKSHADQRQGSFWVSPRGPVRVPRHHL
jgi:hypothetical protein